MDVILDPLTKDAQALAPVIRMLHQDLGAEVRVFLRPRLDLTDRPLSHYYEYAVPRVPTGDDLAARAPAAPGVVLARLPGEPILTMGMDVPEPWLVEPVEARYDLDNVVLKEVREPALDAVFELEALLIQGSCVDTGARVQTQFNPRGLQLLLNRPGAADGSAAANTLVMSNLGYFQLQSSPGSYALTLAPGRSQDIYFVAGASPLGEPWVLDEAKKVLDGRSGADLPIKAPVLVSSFQGLWLQLRVFHRPGREGEDVLAGTDKSESSGGSQEAAGKGAGAALRRLGQLATKALKGGSAATQGSSKVNIFTVASGRSQAHATAVFQCTFGCLLWYVAVQATCTSGSSGSCSCPS